MKKPQHAKKSTQAKKSKPIKKRLSEKSELVSVIVPTYNSGDFLESCLKSIANQTYRNLELIVVDNNSKDKTKEIAKEFTPKVYNRGPERSAQRNYGVKKSKGDYVLIVDSDMELTKNVVKACVEKVQKQKNVKALVIPEESFGEGFWAKCKALERSFYVGVEWMEAARFFEKDAFNALNGYDEENTGTEDYDLPQRMQEKYGKKSVGNVYEYILHNEQKLSLFKSCKKKYYYAQKLDVYKDNPSNFPHYKMQSNPLNRYKLYLRRPERLIKNPVIGAGMLFMKTAEFASGAAGFMRSKLNTEHNK